ncbi:helix-turn-helix domain-containing protein [Roseburia hominis]
MNQEKIGAFLKKLRKEKNVTQEQLAEVFGVSNRTISRWENGINMPDLGLLLDIARYYQVGIEEILNGERTVEMRDEKTEETMYKIAEYTNEEKARFTKRLHYLFIVGVAGIILFLVLDEVGLANTAPYEMIASFGLGIALGMLLCGVIFTSRYGARIREAKMRLLHRRR